MPKIQSVKLTLENGSSIFVFVNEIILLRLFRKTTSHYLADTTQHTVSTGYRVTGVLCAAYTAVDCLTHVVSFWCTTSIVPGVLVVIEREERDRRERE